MIKNAARGRGHHYVNTCRPLTTQSGNVRDTTAWIQAAEVAAREVACFERSVLVSKHASYGDDLWHAARPGLNAIARSEQNDLAFLDDRANACFENWERLLLFPAPRATDNIGSCMRSLLECVLRSLGFSKSHYGRPWSDGEGVIGYCRSVADLVFVRVGPRCGCDRTVIEVVIVRVFEKACVNYGDIDARARRIIRNIEELANGLRVECEVVSSGWNGACCSKQ